MEFAFADPVIPRETCMPLHTGLLVNLSLNDAKASCLFCGGGQQILKRM